MIEREDVIKAVREELGDGDLFLVEVKVRGDEVEVFIDSDGIADDGRTARVTVEDCIRLSRAIEARFDRDEPENDFSLTVSSAGIGQPLRVMRQYHKLVGRQVEVVLASGGAKVVATLEAVEAKATNRRSLGADAVAQATKEGISERSGVNSTRRCREDDVVQGDVATAENTDAAENGAGCAVAENEGKSESCTGKGSMEPGPHGSAIVPGAERKPSNESDRDGVVESITLSYPEKRKVEGKKKPEIVTVTKVFPLAEVKTTKEYIDFK